MHSRNWYFCLSYEEVSILLSVIPVTFEPCKIWAGSESDYAHMIFSVYKITNQPLGYVEYNALLEMSTYFMILSAKDVFSFAIMIFEHGFV